MPERKSARTGKLLALLAALVLIACAVGGSLAYLTAASEPVSYDFEPASTLCSVSTDETGAVYITNSGNTAVYVRACPVLMPDAAGEINLAVTSALPELSASKGWQQAEDGFWYYALPLSPGESASALYPALSASVAAESIQAEPASAVAEAWGVTVADGVISKGG